MARISLNSPEKPYLRHPESRIGRNLHPEDCLISYNRLKGFLRLTKRGRLRGIRPHDLPSMSSTSIWRLYWMRNMNDSNTKATTMFITTWNVSKESREVSQSVNWCFEPSQPQRIISGLWETFIKRHIVERTNQTKIRPQEQSEKAKSCRENLWNESWKGHKDKNKHENRIKRSGQA